MRNKTAKLLRRTTRMFAERKKTPVPVHGYQVVPHTIRHKEHRDPWQLKTELPRFTYNTATLRLVPGCLRAWYQKAKRIYKSR